MATEKQLDRSDYVVIGRRHGSAVVAREAELAEARWERDLPGLTRYGHGPAALARFRALRAAHQQAMSGRPQAVNAKSHLLLDRDRQVSAAWAWMDMARSLVGPLARGDAKVAVALGNALPENDAGLLSGLDALRSLLAELEGRLDEDANVAELLGEAAQIRAALDGAYGQVHSARGLALEDTAELDRLDGELYVRIVDLNAAGRRAIRNGHLAAGLSEYRLQFLKRTGRTLPAPPDGEASLG